MRRDLASLHHELSETIGLLDYAVIYSRALDGQDVDARHAATIRQKLDLITDRVQQIQAKLPEIKHVKAA
jgi:hypothetical protein